jgi:FtsH-binding integral membrane protein
MAPKYFVPIVYLHLLAGTGATYASSQIPIGSGLAYKIGILISSFVALFALFALSPGPLKYVVAALFCALLGQSMTAFVRNLEQRDLLAKSLIGTLGIFLAMTAVGFYDKQNLLGFGPYLLAALVGLLVARIGADLLLPSSSPKSTTVNKAFSWIGVALFAAYTAYDTQVMKADARSNKSPDYINSSLGLYLDFLNLFQSVGSLEE